MNHSYLRKLSALALTALLAVGPARAEDIDLYQGTTVGGTPNLLIILDNSAAADANGPTFTCDAVTVNDPKKNFGFEQCGLYSAVKAIGSDTTLNGNINLGLMYFPPGGTDGGTFVLPAPSPAPKALLTMDGNGHDQKGVDKMLTQVAGLSLSKDKSNNNQIAQAMQEAWAFYNGKIGLSGTQYPGLDSTTCPKNFVLYITLATNNQKPQDTGNRAGNALAAELPGNKVTQVDLKTKYPYKTASGKYQSDFSDEWSQFMHLGNIDTYTIILSDGSNPDYEQLMVSMARESGNEPMVVQLGDVKALVDAIKRIFTNVQAVNSVFAAPVLPVSANTQGTYVNQIYMGMFRPDVEGKPRWAGNLKQYRFGVDITDPNAPELFLADASWQTPSAGTNAMRALFGKTGFIAPSAVSFWTSKSINDAPDKFGGFWSDAFVNEKGDSYDSPDGQFVEKGGVSQQIRLKHLIDTYPATAAATATTSRNVLTCVGSSCAKDVSLRSMRFEAGNVNLTSTALGIASATPAINAINLINWVRGDDTAAAGDSGAGAEASKRPDASITVRGSVHGDVLHSRPVVIDYGGSTGVVVFYGANDGLFRAINGNQPNNPSDSSKPKGFCTMSSSCAISSKDAAGATTSVPPGGELWSFVPQEFYPGLQRLYKNTELLTLGAATGSGKPYFFDGAPGVYYNRVTGKAYLFLSARRGGRLLYALDVSDPTDPKFMWKHTNADTDMAELGQTWSQPKVAMIKGNTNPVLIFGAGYDTAEDSEPPKADTMGRGIFILDAVTGEVLWRAGPGGLGKTCKGTPCTLADMKYAIPADITLVDRDFDGLIDRLYSADTGGNIWRVDLQPDGTGDKSTWQATLFAALGGSDTDATRRKFFFPPDVVLTKNYDVVVSVTGDREHPLRSNQSTSIVNRFYMVKDMLPGMSGSSWTEVRDSSSSTADVAPTGSGAQLVKVTDDALYDGVAPGFYVTLGNSGEKGVNAPTTVGGKVIFGTNEPTAPANRCEADLGTARSYGVDFLKGKTTYTNFNGGGLVPSPAFGIVTVNVGGQDRQLPFLIGGGGNNGPDGTSGLGAQKPKINLKATKRRTYWYRETDR